MITLIVGREQRLFAAHEDILCLSPFFQSACHGQFSGAESKRIALPDEDPIIFSSILEYLYKGDYSPRLLHDKRHNSWALEKLESDGRGQLESTVYDDSMDGQVLKDTVIYCAAEKYGLEELKKMALRKQGLRKLDPLHFAHPSTSSNQSHLILYFDFQIYHESIPPLLLQSNNHHRVRHTVLHDPNFGQICIRQNSGH